MSTTASTEARASRSESPFRIAVTPPSSWARQLLTAGMRLWIVRCDERILLQAPTHQLRDIGIDRADFSRAVRSWRVRPR